VLIWLVKIVVTQEARWHPLAQRAILSPKPDSIPEGAVLVMMKTLGRLGSQRSSYCDAVWIRCVRIGGSRTQSDLLRGKGGPLGKLTSGCAVTQELGPFDCRTGHFDDMPTSRPSGFFRIADRSRQHLSAPVAAGYLSC
jgi:hypothetical protein